MAWSTDIDASSITHSHADYSQHQPSLPRTSRFCAAWDWAPQTLILADFLLKFPNSFFLLLDFALNFVTIVRKTLNVGYTFQNFRVFGRRRSRYYGVACSTHYDAKLLGVKLCWCSEHLAVVFPLRRIVESIEQLELVSTAKWDTLFMDGDVHDCGFARFDIATVRLDHVIAWSTHSKLIVEMLVRSAVADGKRSS